MKSHLPSSARCLSANGRLRSLPPRLRWLHTRKEQAPKLARAEQQKIEATAKLEADLKAYESTVVVKRIADWEKEQSTSILNRWLVVQPTAMSATNGSILTKQSDGSILVSGPNRNGVITITAETELAGVSGLRLEVLTDDSLPQKGPGRASDGNFVLNEIEFIAAPKADPKQAKPVKLTNALADFNQENLDVSKGNRW